MHLNRNIYDFEIEKKILKIGLVLDQAYQSSKLATLIISMMKKYLFDNYPITQIIGEVFDFNVKAIGLMNKLDFKKIEIIKHKLLKRNKYIDMYIFSFHKSQLTQNGSIFYGGDFHERT
ncbi:GNAT family N-acetyltransferase [Rummeliibacillus sp. SL167]|uniref:GNAT family N-acetyltransferase n=1 Tax=Rummeliibacillus sp. SL167 TaxID=2579792 RepID=UPI001C94877A